MCGMGGSVCVCGVGGGGGAETDKWTRNITMDSSSSFFFKAQKATGDFPAFTTFFLCRFSPLNGGFVSFPIYGFIDFFSQSFCLPSRGGRGGDDRATLGMTVFSLPGFNGPACLSREGGRQVA